MEVNNSNEPVNPAQTPIQATPHPINNQRGNLPIILGVIVLLLVVGGGAYYLGTQKQSTGAIDQKIQSTPSPVVTSEPSPSTNEQTSDTSNWKTFTSSSAGITLKYPTSWVTPENSFISEKTFVPGEQDRSKTYNIIEIQKYPTQLYVGYTNSEWFNKINSSTAPISDQRETRTKLTSGTVASGEQYVIFTDEPSATAQSEGFKQVKAYILKGQTIYQLTLDMYDQGGLDTFKIIVPSAVVN